LQRPAARDESLINQVGWPVESVSTRLSPVSADGFQPLANYRMLSILLKRMITMRLQGKIYPCERYIP
jgi:hypothetical protein